MTKDLSLQFQYLFLVSKSNVADSISIIKEKYVILSVNTTKTFQKCSIQF